MKRRWSLQTLFSGKNASQSLGRRGEKVAARYLRSKGWRIVGRNVRCGGGEIDLVAMEGPTLVFVEVKSRSSRSWSEDVEKIDRRKKRVLKQACWSYLRALSRDVESYRVDAISIDFAAGRWRPRPREIRWFPAVLDLDGF